jgi:hypothetical protein
MSKPLRDLKTRPINGPVDLAEMTIEIARTLVDVIMQREKEGQGALFALALTSLGEDYLQRRGAFDSKPKGH